MKRSDASTTLSWQLVAIISTLTLVVRCADGFASLVQIQHSLLPTTPHPLSRAVFPPTFSSISSSRNRKTTTRRKSTTIRSVLLLALRATEANESSSSSSETEEKPTTLTPTERILENEKLGPAERAIVEAAAAKRAETTTESSNKYPLDLPSPLLLATSIVLAIVSTGSFFSLLGTSSGEEPVLGFAPTAAIVVIGFPLCAFLFYAAIVKAQDETEKDDKAFLSGK